MRSAPLLLLLASLAAFTACMPPGSGAPGPGGSREAMLRAAVSAHLAAIQARDLEALLATVTAADDLPLIFPDGSITLSRREYVDFHVAWFADTAWAMTFQPVSLVARPGLGVALLRTTYTDGRGTRDGLVALTFAWENGEWRLAFDQNTRVVGP